MIHPEPTKDHRGYFARVFDRDEFVARGIEADVLQANTSFNEMGGTLRGMHLQRRPGAETKLVRCTRGSLYDVIVDLRPDSPSFMEHYGVILSQSNLKMIYVPRGVAHGYLTLEDGTEAHYMVSERYAPIHEGGVRHDDPAFGIEWPREVLRISDKDASWPDFDVSIWRW